MQGASNAGHSRMILVILLMVKVVTAIVQPQFPQMPQFPQISNWGGFPTMPPFPSMPATQPPQVTQGAPVTQPPVTQGIVVTQAVPVTQWIPITTVPPQVVTEGTWATTPLSPVTQVIPITTNPFDTTADTFTSTTLPPTTVFTTIPPTFAPAMQPEVVFTTTLSPSSLPVEFLSTTPCPTCAPGTIAPVMVVTTQAPVTQPPDCQTKEGKSGICISAVYCMDTVGNQTTSCVAGQTLGICCPKMVKPEETKVAIPTQIITTSRMSYINKDEYEHKNAVEQKLFQMGIQLPNGTAESQMQAFHQTFDSALRVSSAFQEHQISSQSRGRAMITTTACPPPPPCTQHQLKYRSLDGSCNNLENPEFGKAMRGFRRLLPAKYDDGKNSPRTKGIDGAPLTGARKIVTTAFQDKDNPHPAVSLMFMQWGQILGHDTSLSAITKGKDGSSITCCSEAVLADDSLRHPACFGIDIPHDDPFYKQFNVKCMEFVRSLAGPTHDCKPGPREQINQVTSSIDGSLVYTSGNGDIKDLRAFTGGLMKTSRWNNVDLLPFDPDSSCSKKQKNLFCYKAGDFRINMTPDLTSLQTIFLREHNRLASELARRNPSWDDEKLFEEARRVVGAELQHITYNEYLPILLGPDLVKQFQLTLQKAGYSFLYNNSMDSTLMNEHSTAAYRLGHTQIAWDSEVYDKNDQKVNSYPLRDEFFSPYRLQMPGHLDQYIRGLCRQSMQRFDHYITKEITDHLFQVGRAFGLDLMSFDIQRGRDHGIRPYNEYRETCGLPRARNWDDLTNFLRPEVIEPLKTLYRNVEDLDLFVGGMLERSLKKANMGPTFACIIAEQFRRLKLGDRFFYENGKQPNSFTPAQLQEIRKVKLSKIICENSDGIKTLQTEAFIKPSKWNPQVPCSNIPSVDLNAWIGT